MSHKVKLVHGIRTKDGGKKTFKKLSHYLQVLLEDSCVDLVNYGYILIPVTNKIAVKSITEALEPLQDQPHPITVVAHSNGCWAAVQTAEIGYRIDHLVLINPALHKAHAFPEHIKRVDVYYAPNDHIVAISKWYRRIVNLLPWNWGVGKHDWGEMGKTGYIGNDARVFNHNMGTVSHFFYEIEGTALRIAKDIDKLYEGGLV